MTRLTAEDLVSRFDGELHHFQGRSKNYVGSTSKRGKWRFLLRIGRYDALMSSPDYLAPAEPCKANRYRWVSERYTKAENDRAQRILLARAKALPPYTPTLSGLNTFLHQIDATTLDPVQVWDHVRQWCGLIEVWCRTPEAARVYDLRHEQLIEYAPDFAAMLSEAVRS